MGSLRRAIDKAEQKLSALDAFTTQKQHAITTVLNLQMAGIGEKDIAELTAVVNTWNAMEEKSECNGKDRTTSPQGPTKELTGVAEDR